jgi:glycosyltransferase involved in cell wall biosynthesis
VKLAIVIDSLVPGGTQRFAAILSDGLVARGHGVCVITLTAADGADFFPLPPEVERIRLSLDRAYRRGPLGKLARDAQSVRHLRRAIKASDPDVVLSLGWSTNVITILSSRLLRIPLVVSERIDPRDYHVGRGWRIAQRVTYPFVQRLIVQTETVRDVMQRWVRRGRIAVLPNPVPERAFAVTRAPADVPTVVAVGRLTEQKGFDTLVKAFAGVSKAMPDAELSIVGDGPLRRDLEDLARSFLLTSHVTFHGTLNTPSDVSRTAWCGCVASRSEGFPNVLLEFMAMGLPVVSTDCRSGPAELLADGAGVLVPVDDVSAMASALIRLLATSDEAAQLGRAAQQRASDYSEHRVVDAWCIELAAVVD